jgi:hypothetical protein
MQAESTAVSGAQLTLVEIDSLAGHEATIERHLDTFVAVGEALLAIRDGRLYRETHDTFEDYCRERWGLARKRGYDLMAAAQVSAVLSPIGDTPGPANEAVARELAPLRDEPERLREAWQEAVERHGPEPTAAEVREIVKPTLAPPPEPILGQTALPTPERPIPPAPPAPILTPEQEEQAHERQEREAATLNLIDVLRKAAFPVTAARVQDYVAHIDAELAGALDADVSAARVREAACWLLAIAEEMER